MSNVNNGMDNLKLEDLIFTNYGTYSEVTKCIDPQSDLIVCMTKSRWNKSILIIEGMLEKEAYNLR